MEQQRTFSSINIGTEHCGEQDAIPGFGQASATGTVASVGRGLLGVGDDLAVGNARLDGGDRVDADRLGTLDELVEGRLTAPL